MKVSEIKTVQDVYTFANRINKRVFHRKNIYFVCPRGTEKKERFHLKYLTFIDNEQKQSSVLR